MGLRQLLSNLRGGLSGTSEPKRRYVLESLEPRRLLHAASLLLPADFSSGLPAGSIAGVVHVDSVRNGHYDSGEAGLAGITLHLLDVEGHVLAATTSDANGNYQFSGLAPGTYAVHELQPPSTFHGGEEVGSGGGRAIGDLLYNIPLDCA